MKAKYRLVGYKEDNGRYYTWRIWDSTTNQYAGNIDGYAPYLYAKKECFSMNEAERNKK